VNLNKLEGRPTKLYGFQSILAKNKERIPNIFLSSIKIESSPQGQQRQKLVLW